MTKIASNAPADFSGLPFDDIRSLVRAAPAFNDAAAAHAQAHQRNLCAPPAARGRLAPLAVWLAGWTDPSAMSTGSMERIQLCLFASAHGWLTAAALEEAQDAVKQRLLLLSAGGAAATIMGGSMGAGVKVFDLAIDAPTPDPRHQPTLSERDCVAAMAFGMEATAGGFDALAIAVTGAGTRVAAAAVACGLYGGAPSHWLAGMTRDLGVDYPTAIATLEGLPDGNTPDPLELLRRVGGRDLAAAVGAILAARLQYKPVILEGYEATVAAAVLAHVAPGSVDHCLLASREGSAAHDHLIAALGLEPLLDLGMEGADGLSALLAGQMVQAAARLHRDLATRPQLHALLSDQGA